MSSSNRPALLFDIDGTLSDTDSLHLLAFNETFAPYGHHFDKARYNAEIQGQANVAIMKTLMPGLTEDRQMAVMEEKEALFRQKAASLLKPLEGLLALMDWADENNIVMAAVTNAPRANADMTLASIGVTPRFGALVIGAELPHGKPHPMPYLEGLRLLGADPARSVAFEDSRAGVASATAAGLKTVGIMTSLSAQDMVQAGAALAVHDYEDAGLRNFIKETLGL